jgi:hypothetical protein
MAHKPDLQDLGWTKVWSTVRVWILLKL